MISKISSSGLCFSLCRIFRLVQVFLLLFSHPLANKVKTEKKLKFKVWAVNKDINQNTMLYISENTFILKYIYQIS